MDVILMVGFHHIDCRGAPMVSIPFGEVSISGDEKAVCGGA